MPKLSEIKGWAAEAGMSPEEYIKAWNISTADIQPDEEPPSLTQSINGIKPPIATEAESLDLDTKLTKNQKWGNFFDNPYTKTGIKGAELISNALGPKSEYNGPKAAITQGMDSAYDTAMDVAGKLPAPYGPVISGLMGANKVLGNVANKLGAGTDGMTSTDAILGSSFFQLTPLGLINGFGGKKADTFLKNDDVFAQVGSSYQGTESLADDALTKSGKKYGMFSNSARKQANREIAEAKIQQNTMEGIATDASNRFAIQEGMSAINGGLRQYNLQGGYNQAAVHAGKHGMSISRAKRISSNNKIKERFKPNIKEEPKFKNGGVIEEQYSLDDFFNTDWEYKDYSIPEEQIDKFQNGGSFNVIPEGALHAHKHNMDLEGVTKKGIPVISQEEGGEIEQHAEIERDEVIFRLEVSKKIEELQEKYESDEYTRKEKDEFAIECGKLLTYELLENTQDRTGLIDKV